jgi:hypothetical protein
VAISWRTNAVEIASHRVLAMTYIVQCSRFRLSRLLRPAVRAKPIFLAERQAAFDAAA